MAERKTCSTCIYWERDITDGICYGGEAPCPQILEGGKSYQLVWPRTNPENACRNHMETPEVVQ